MLYIPILEGNLVPIHRESRLKIYFGYKGDLYFFNAIAKERFYKDKLALFTAERLGELKKIQRRAFYRLECMVNIKYRVFDSFSQPIDERGEFLGAVTSDISGGGIKMFLKEKYDLGKLIEGILELGSRQCSFVGRIVRCLTNRDIGEIRYDVGVQFYKIDDKNREELITYIFEQQRNLLKKGMS